MSSSSLQETWKRKLVTRPGLWDEGHDGTPSRWKQKIKRRRLKRFQIKKTYRSRGSGDVHHNHGKNVRKCERISKILRRKCLRTGCRRYRSRRSLRSDSHIWKRGQESAAAYTHVWKGVVLSWICCDRSQCNWCNSSSLSKLLIVRSPTSETLASSNSKTWALRLKYILVWIAVDFVCENSHIVTWGSFLVDEEWKLVIGEDYAFFPWLLKKLVKF